MAKNSWRTPYGLRGRGKGIVTTSYFTREVGKSYLLKAVLNWQDRGETMTAAFCSYPVESHSFNFTFNRKTVKGSAGS